MPNLKIPKARFDTLMGKQYPFPQLQELGFQFGVEIEREDGEGQMDYKFDCMNNRPDLLTQFTLTRALKIYMGVQPVPQVRLLPPKTSLKVNPSVSKIRPIVAAAILRDVHFDEFTYKAFISAQEKLHATFCRARKYASIGTHDLDTIEGPFIYTAQPPTQFQFIPLNFTESVNGLGMMDKLQNHKLKEYLHLIKDSPVYPLILDAKGRVCSVPPIINSEHSKISINTQNILIEVTALTRPKANVCLNTMIWSFSELCKNAFTVEAVEIITESETIISPAIGCRKFTMEHKNAVKLIGSGSENNLNPEDVATSLKRTGLKGQWCGNGVYEVEVPFWRGDVLHECDLLEDVVICYGYNKIIPQLPQTITVGSRLPLNKLTDHLRRELAQVQFNQVLNFALCSKADLTTKIRSEDASELIIIENPNTKQFQTGRTTLISGLLKTIVENKSSPLPMQLFEAGDCILVNPKSDTGSSNSRRLAAIITDEIQQGSKKSIFSLVHGALDTVLLKCKAVFGKDYSLLPSEDALFFEGMQFKVQLEGKTIGRLGVIHPRVVKNFGWMHQCAAWEIDLEALLNFYQKRLYE